MTPTPQPRLSAVEAEAILILAHVLARATANYAMEPFSEQEDAMKKAEKKLREMVYKLAGSE
jgi:hypothetical protein